MLLSFKNQLKKWKNSLRQPVLASLGFTAVSLVCKLLLVVFTPIFTRLLTPSEYGVYTLFSSFVGVFFIVCTLDLTGGALYRGLLIWGRENAYSFLYAAALLLLLPIMLAFTVFLFFSDAISSFLSLPTPLVYFLFAEILGDALLSVSSAYCRYYSYPLRYAVTTLAFTFFSLIFTLVLILATPFRSEARVVATASVSLAVGILALFTLLKGRKKEFSFDVWRFLCRCALPLFPHALCLCLLTNLGRLSVGRLLGTGMLSSFGLSMSIGMAPCFLTVGIQSAYAPWLLRKTAAGKHKEIAALTGALAFFIGTVCLSVSLAAPEILAFLAPESYRDSLYAVGIVSLGVLPLFLFNVFVGIELCDERTWRLSAATLPITVLFVIGFLCFVPKYGVLAATVLTPFSYLSLALSHALLLKLTKRKTLLPFARLFLCYLVFCAATLGAPLLYELPLLRYLLIFLFMAASFFVLWLQKDKLLEPK